MTKTATSKDWPILLSTGTRQDFFNMLYLKQKGEFMLERNMIVAGDFHAGFTDKKAMRSFEQVLADNFYTDYVVLGDVVDWDSISKFALGRPGLLVRRIADQSKEAKETLARHISLLERNNPQVRLYFCTGNHEYRLEDYIERNPALSGLLSLQELLGLDYLGFTCYPIGDILKIGQVSFCHGVKHGVNHARGTAMQSQTPYIVYGHVHSLEAGTTQGFGGAKERAFSAGCLCSLKMGYQKKQGYANNWEHGYVEVKIKGPKVNILQHRL